MAIIILFQLVFKADYFYVFFTVQQNEALILALLVE